MNTESPAALQTPETLLTLVMPPTLTDPVVDWLLEQPEVTGFISLPVNSHGGEVHAMSAAEQVAGYRKGWMVQTHLPQRQAGELLDRLKKAFANSEIHFWMTPLLAGGHLG